MTLVESIVEHGIKAVLAYREISGNENDNQVPEVFLGSWIARGLHEDLGVSAHVERCYTRVAFDLGMTVTPELVGIMGGWRADVVVYEGGRPKALVEIKIHDERGSDGLILRDLDKMRRLSGYTGLQTCLAVLVTEVATGPSCEERASRLGTFLGGMFDVLGDPRKANGGTADWSWQFVCGSFV